MLLFLPILSTSCPLLSCLWLFDVCEAVNSCPAVPLRSMVRFQLLPSGDSSSSSHLTVTKSSLPALVDHPLGQTHFTSHYIYSYLNSTLLNHRDKLPVFPLCSVTGPKFHKIRVGVGHRLDAFSSGVLGNTIFKKVITYVKYSITVWSIFSVCFSVLGLRNGNTALESLYRSHVTRVNVYLLWCWCVSSHTQQNGFHVIFHVTPFHEKSFI